MLAIISPSKTLDESSAYPTVKLTQPRLLDDAKTLNALLRQQDETSLSSLMNISSKLAALNHARNHAFVAPFTKSNARPALYMFKGDVYEGLDSPTLTADEVKYTSAHLRILSGQYGLLRPLDLMQAYRLEMGTALANPRGKNLYAFWGRTLAQLLNEDAKAADTDIVLNLASEEYAKAVDRKTLKLREITVQFKERRGNKLQIIALMAKRARGMMARHLAQTHATQLDDVHEFTAGGYAFDEALSTDSTLVFVR